MFNLRQQRRVVAALVARLQAAGLLDAGVRLALSDENRVDRAASSLAGTLARRVVLRPGPDSGNPIAKLKGLSQAELAAVAHINTHGVREGRVWRAKRVFMGWAASQRHNPTFLPPPTTPPFPLPTAPTNPLVRRLGRPARPTVALHLCGPAPVDVRSRVRRSPSVRPTRRLRPGR